MRKGAVKKYRNDTAATPPHCHFDGQSADNRKASYWAFHDSINLIAAGDFGAQSLNRTKGIIIHNYMQHRSK